MKIVFSSYYITDITYIQHLFNQHKIKYYLSDEQMINILPHYSVALNGYKISVNDKDYENARKIIEKYLKKPEKPVEKHVYTNKKEIICPNCGSKKIDEIKKPISFLSLIFSLFFMFPFPIRKKYLQCRKCNSYWKTNEFRPLSFIFILVVLIVIYILLKVLKVI